MSRYSAYSPKVTSPSQAIEDSKRVPRLRDDSWIRKADDEYEAVDRDPNFGRSVLGRQKSNEGSLSSKEPEEVNTTKVPTRTSSVQALTKRFGGSQDELNSSPPPSKTRSTSTSKSTYSSPKSDYPSTYTSSRTTVRDEPKTSTSTTTVSKDGGKTTETTTTITSTQSVRSPITPTKTFNERVQSSVKGSVYSPYSPTTKPTVPETILPSNKDAEDKLYDSLIPSSISGSKTVTKTETVTLKKADDLAPWSPRKADETDSKTTTTETVTVKGGTPGDSFTTTTTTRTLSTAEDELYDTLLPAAITSPVSSGVTKSELFTVESSRGGDSPTVTSPTSRISRYSSYTDDVPSTRTSSYTISSSNPSDDYSSDRKSYSYSRPNSSYEYSSVTSPTDYTSSSYRRRSEDLLLDPAYSKSSTKSVYTAPERTVLEKDLCTSCRKPFMGDAKMVLDDMKINCHASCFKCAVCNSTLGHLKAGDSMWIYKHMVHCDSCFEITREKWRR